MFNEYQSAVTTAIESGKNKNDEYDTLKESLTIQIKTKMEEECKNIQSNSQLKDYSPIKHYNEMTELRHQFDKINKDLEKELDEIKDNFHDSLIKLILPELDSNSNSNNNIGIDLLINNGKTNRTRDRLRKKLEEKKNNIPLLNILMKYPN